MNAQRSRVGLRNAARWSYGAADKRETYNPRCLDVSLVLALTAGDGPSKCWVRG